jgi:hypothetical protein
MIRGATFKAVALLMGLSGLFVWGITTYQNWDFNAHSRPAMAESVWTRPTEQNVVVYKTVIEGIEKIQVELKFRTESGEQIRISPYVSRAVVDQLVKGEKVELRYLQDRPQRIEFKGEVLKKDTLFLVIGLVMTGVFLLALKAS